MDFLTLAKDRYSCRKLTDAPIEPQLIEKIIDCALSSPTGCNNQPYRIWVMQSEKAQEILRAVTNYTFGSKFALVVGCKEEEAYVRPFDGRNFADVDAAIVSTQIMFAIHELGLRSTWVAHFNAPKLKELCPEMAPYELIAIFPIGYPAEDAVPSPKHTQKRDRSEIVKVL